MIETWERQDREHARRVQEYQDRELARIPVREYRQDNRKVPNRDEEALTK